MSERGFRRKRKGLTVMAPFREAFQNGMVFVYGTASSDPAMVRWCRNKARLDAEVFWYRGNGALRLMSDTAFLAAVEKNPDEWSERNVILYGGRDSNQAYSSLLEECPIDVGQGFVRVGERQWTGDQYGCLFVRPKKGSKQALVGVQAGSGITGCRVLDHVPLFVSGVGLPDYVVVTPDVFESTTKGIVAAGYFDHRWRLVEPGRDEGAP